MGVFSDISSQLSIQAAEFENEQLAALLVSNPVMSDGNALFSAPHNNLAAAGTVIDSAGLSAGRLAMRMQTNANGQPIAVAPRYLLTSAGKETESRESSRVDLPAYYGRRQHVCRIVLAGGRSEVGSLESSSAVVFVRRRRNRAGARVLLLERIRRAARIHSRWVPGRIRYRRNRSLVPVGLRLRRCWLAGRV